VLPIGEGASGQRAHGSSFACLHVLEHEMQVLPHLQPFLQSGSLSNASQPMRMKQDAIAPAMSRSMEVSVMCRVR
jgi:hypothetical protein